MKKPIKKRKQDTTTVKREFPGDMTYFEAIADVAKEHPEKKISMPSKMFLEALDQFEYITMCRVIEEIQQLVDETPEKCLSKKKKSGSVKSVVKK